MPDPWHHNDICSTCQDLGVIRTLATKVTLFTLLKPTSLHPANHRAYPKVFHSIPRSSSPLLYCIMWVNTLERFAEVYCVADGHPYLLEDIVDVEKVAVKNNSRFASVLDFL